jgi:rubredoxin
MDRYVCSVCGHVYDLEKGEPQQDLPPGMAFVALPDDWQCPICFAAKNEFVKE